MIIRRRSLNRTLVVVAAASLLLGLVAIAPAAGDTESRAGTDGWPGTQITALPFGPDATVTSVGVWTPPGPPGDTEPVPTCAGGAHSRSVWYWYLVPAATTLTASTTGSDYDTVIAAYTGTPPTLTQIGCANTPLATEQLTFAAPAGVVAFQVSQSGAAGAGGNLAFSLSATGLGTAASDNHVTATQITLLPFNGQTNTTTFGANEPLEKAPCGVAAHTRSAWYRYQATATGVLTANTAGSNYTTVLQVYQTDWQIPLVGVCSVGVTPVSFSATAGTWYYFQISDATGGAGGDLRFSLTGGTGWDDFYSAQVITAVPYSHSGDTTMATLQTGEPKPVCAPAHDNSVWYRYSPTTSMTLTADTKGSNYDTVLAVYAGTNLTTLIPVGCNDDISATDDDSQVTFTANAYTTYYFQVSSWGNPSNGGSLVFHLAGGAAWDDYYQPLTINTLPYTHSGSTTPMTLQANEPMPSCATGHNRSVWYKYTPTVDTPIRADTRGASYDTVLAVYRGTWTNRVTCNDDISATDLDSEVTFTALANNAYYFQVSAAGSSSTGGNLVFHVYAGPEPPWDDYTDPFEFDDLPFSDLDVDTTMATTQTNEPVPSCVSGHSNSVWYEFTPDHDWAVTADTIGSNYDTVLAVYEGDLDTPIACNDDGGSTTSVVEFTAEEGETYLFQISSKGSTSDGGSLDFHVEGLALPQYCRGVEATIVGTNGADVLYGTDNADVIVGLDGNDMIFGSDGDDLICGGRGDDRVYAGDGDDTVYGEGGADILYGGIGADELYGWGGDDLLFGNNGDDTMRGGAGDDGLYAGADEDDARGGGGDDTVYGGPHDDVLMGNAGFDILRGGGGDDWCHSGEDVIC